MADFDQTPSANLLHTDELLRDEVLALRERLTRLEQAVLGQPEKAPSSSAVAQRNLTKTATTTTAKTEVSLLNLDKLFNRH